MGRVGEPQWLGFQSEGRPGVAGWTMVRVVRVTRGGAELVLTKPAVISSTFILTPVVGEMIMIYTAIQTHTTISFTVISWTLQNALELYQILMNLQFILVYIWYRFVDTYVAGRRLGCTAVTLDSLTSYPAATLATTAAML